ncbi:MAG: hypothetical protein JWM80_6464 [Cyanobacteria bacterium RYN_339]|nr:hypothetical protein [Cyanobacteria bacterium RYN_339]
MRRMLASLAAAAMLAACGSQGSTGPGAVATARPGATPVPVLAGPLVRMRAAVFGTPPTRALIGSNAAPGANAGFTLALGDQAAYHVQRAQAEARALAGLPAPAPHYALAQTHAVGETQPFWVFTDDTPGSEAEVQVQATLAAVGQHCYVWNDPAGNSSPHATALLAARIREIADTFDAQIYPTDTRLFGSEANPGVDGDPRIHILISPAVSQGGGGTTLGYFSRRDAYPANPNGRAIMQHSNAKELINVATRIVLTGSQEDYLGTLAHEFEHMINFNQKVLLGKNAVGEDLWIDEGMAMYALEANGYGLRGGGRVLLNHVRDFQAQPETYSLNEWDANPHGIGYGPVYLFMVYVADRFGEGILHEIVSSPQIGFPNLEARLNAHGSRFSDLFADWAAANVVDHVPGMPPTLTYKLIDMHGSYGGTPLTGFYGNSVAETGISNLSLRPCSLFYAELPSGVGLPAFKVGAGVTVEPPLGQ